MRERERKREREGEKGYVRTSSVFHSHGGERKMRNSRDQEEIKKR